MEKLTNRELQVMEVFWNTEEPLTTVDLFKMHEGEWTRNFVQNVVSRLADKGYIEQCGMVRCNTQYARTFKTSVSREEYSSILMSDLKVSPDKLTDIVLRFAGENDGISKEQIIEQLERAVVLLREMDD